MEYERLLNVAKALREAPDPDKFDMSFYGHGCGAPACAVGHYAARRDLQDTFVLNKDGFVDRRHPVGSQREAANFSDFAAHFGLSRDQTEGLFDANGCGMAETPLEAAEYIEDFVRRHRDSEAGQMDERSDRDKLIEACSRIAELTRERDIARDVARVVAERFVKRCPDELPALPNSSLTMALAFPRMSYL